MASSSARPAGAASSSRPREVCRRVAQPAGALSQCDEEDIVLRFGEPCDPLDRRRERVARDARQHGLSHRLVRRGLVQDQGAGVPQLQRRRVEVPQGSEPCFLRGRPGLSGHRGEDRVEQVDHVVGGRGLQGAHEGQQRGRAPVVGQPRHRPRARAAEAKRASAVTLPGGRRSTSGRPRPMARISSRRATARPISGPLRMKGPSRSRSSGLCRASSGTARSASRRSRCSGVSAPASRRNRRSAARAHPGDDALEHGQARQQRLGREQPGHRAIEQRRGMVGPCPAEREEEAVEPEGDPGVGELPIAVALADAGPVPPSTLACAVGGEGPGVIGDLDLVGHVANRRGGDLGEVVDEGAAPPDGPERDGDTEPVVGTPVLGPTKAWSASSRWKWRASWSRVGSPAKRPPLASPVVGDEARGHRDRGLTRPW